MPRRASLPRASRRPTDVVLCGLRADEQPLGDLAIRQPVARGAGAPPFATAQQPRRPRPGSTLHTQGPHERSRSVGVAERAERLELGARVPCRVDRDVGRGHGSARASSSRVRAASRRAPSAANRLTASSRSSARFRAPFGVARSDHEPHVASASTRSRPDARRSRRAPRPSCRPIEYALEQPRLDELREERRGEQARPPELVEPTCQEADAAAAASPRAMRTATRAAGPPAPPSRPSSSCSASSKRPWSTRISARRADGGMHRERCPAARAHARRARAPPRLSRHGRSPCRRRRSTSDRTRGVLRGRAPARSRRGRRSIAADARLSPARSHASISVQQMSANVSSVAGSPLVAAAMASSSRVRPRSTSPRVTSARPSWASARSSRSASPVARATSRAADAKQRGRAWVARTFGARQIEPALLRTRLDVAQEPLGACEPPPGRSVVVE